MDIGLFGGTFNPLHNGHIGIAQYVRQACSLDKIFLFPSATPPHKPPEGLAPARDRLEMVGGSVAGIEGLIASDIELKRHGPSFTIDTIEAFKSLHGPEVNFFLIVGSDAFFDILGWKEKNLIFKALPLVIMLRGEKQDKEAIGSFIDEKISKGYRWNEADSIFTHNSLHPIRICNVPRIDISSTMIRERIRKNQPITGLVPAIVETIIKKKDLYQ